jgi:hypothetical protein
MQPSPVMSRNDTGSQIIGSHAEYRHSDYFFARSQSDTLRQLPWASRARPLRAWGGPAALLVAGTALAALVSIL